MKEIKFLHNRKPKKCCGNIDNLEPVLLHLKGGCAYTHFCSNCGRLELSEIASPADLTDSEENIGDIVAGRIQFITYPLASYKSQKDLLGQLDNLTKKIIIPFKNANKEDSSEKPSAEG